MDNRCYKVCGNQPRTTLLPTLFSLLPSLGLVRLSLLLGEVTGRDMVLNGEGRELGIDSLVSGALEEKMQHNPRFSSSKC